MSKQPQRPLMPCPRGKNHKVTLHGQSEFYCTVCRMLFDNDPDEGGTHGDRPEARMMREERAKGGRRG